MKIFGARTFCIVIMVSCTSHNVLPPASVFPVPTEEQLAWHDMEQNAFIHFSINTFTDKEWGYGDESEKLFNPSHLNATQWMGTLKNAGFKGVILTCKHHDGFCLWPTIYSEHSIRQSPYKNGKGDIVKEVSEAAKNAGLKFGIYVSPWDRNRADYGTPAYLTIYRQQLKELFVSYGPFFEMWFDGANGGDGYYGGAKEKRKIDGAHYYQWPETLAGIRKISPRIIFFSDAGPGVRWVGNERGEAGRTNWNTITPDTLFAGKAGIESLLNSGSDGGTHWIPAEVDVSIRPGWFYHEKEDSLVKTPSQLLSLYLTSVGRGATLLLNVPPDRRGLIPKRDSTILQEWRSLIAHEFKTNLARKANVTADSWRGDDPHYNGMSLTDGNPETYWATNDGITTGNIEIDLGTERRVRYIVLKEYIRLGQRVRNFTIDVWHDKRWNNVAKETTIGHKRIVKIDDAMTGKIRISVTDARACPLISEIEVY